LAHVVIVVKLVAAVVVVVVVKRIAEGKVVTVIGGALVLLQFAVVGVIAEESMAKSCLEYRQSRSRELLRFEIRTK
jgi:hypothetical protein